MDIRKNILPVLCPMGGQEEVQALSEVIYSGWWGAGKKVEEFEDRFAKMVGHKYSVAVTSNSHGMDLIFKAMGFKRIDVISHTMSFISTAVVPLWNGCTSNLVDVDPKTLCIDPVDVARFKKPDSEVLIAVNLSGVPAPYDHLRKVFGGFIIEDCAHSCHTEGAGLSGDVAIWSFQALKTLPTGDGGMITTDDQQLYNKLKELIWFGIPSTWSRMQKNASGAPGYSWDYNVTSLGYKNYMTDLTAAIGLVQLKKLHGHLRFRRHIQRRYTDELYGYIEAPAFSDTVQHYCARVHEMSRDNLISYLAGKMIHTSVHYKPLHHHDLLKQDRRYPVADTEWLRLISLPVSNRMNEEDIDYVIFWIKEYFKNVDY